MYFINFQILYKFNVFYTFSNLVLIQYIQKPMFEWRISRKEDFLFLDY